MDKIELHLIALTKSESRPGSFAMILEEEIKNRKLPIIIGQAEAQAIAVVLEKVTLDRPQPHDLLQNTIKALGGKLEEVQIHDFSKGRYVAQLVLKQGAKTLMVDSRTSDAIALAVRVGCPIFTYNPIIEKVFEKQEKEDASFSRYTQEELEFQLKQAVANENFEKATQLKDELDRRK